MRSEIIFEDKEILVIKKPAGLATQSGRIGEADVESELKNYRKTKGEPPEIFTIHRLDKPVSGLLVFAKNKKAAAELNKQLTNNTLNKTYTATVMGDGPEEAVVKGFIKKEKDMAVFSLEKISSEYKTANLSYKTVRTVDAGKDIYEIKVNIKTGRFHQIRATLAAIGRPLLGDRKYGTEESIAMSEEMGIKNVALTADSIEFIHPVTKKKISL